MKRMISILISLILIFTLGASTAHAQVAGEAPLTQYWSASSEAARTLADYIRLVTDESSAAFIPEKDRIAVFDLDGTLMCETYPWCFEYMVFADYVLNNPDYDAPEEVRAVAQEIVDSAWGEKPANMSVWQASAGAVAYAGMTPDELIDYVKAFRSSDAEGYTGISRGEAWFLPMLEVMDFLQENGFEIYIVTATERNVVRGIVDGILDITPSHVIGTEYGYTATGQGDTQDSSYTFQPTDTVVFSGTYEGENAKMSKVDAIVREIGQQPVLAFGNSSGDVAMLQYTITANPYPAAAFMVLADDPVRDYGKEDNGEKRQGYEDLGFCVISMRDDFAVIYPKGAVKAPESASEMSESSPVTAQKSVIYVKIL